MLNDCRLSWFARGLSLASVTLLVAAFHGVPVAAQVDGVFGTDERRIVQNREAFQAVGQVNISGYRERSQCSGVLVAPDRVLTAAHCIYDSDKAELKPAKSIHFLAGAHLGETVGHSRADCVRLVGANGTGRTFPAFYGPDLAVIVLRAPLAISPMPISLTPLTGKPALTHAGYPTDRRHVLSVHRNCTLMREGRSRWLTSCDTNYGGSGGPILVSKEKGALEVAAIMYGIVPKRFSLAVPIAPYMETIEKLQCE